MVVDSMELWIETCPGGGMPGAVLQARDMMVDDCVAGAEGEPAGTVDGYAGASVGQADGEESRVTGDSSGRQKAMAAWTAVWRHSEAGESTVHGRDYQGTGGDHRRKVAGEQIRAVVGSQRQMDGAEPRSRTSVVLCSH
jgi:hypothetical protein